MPYGLIYNSRNYVCLLDLAVTDGVNVIYNSRNYVCLLDEHKGNRDNQIYNSRNYVCLLDTEPQIWGRVKSTTVEIMCAS